MEIRHYSFHKAFLAEGSGGEEGERARIIIMLRGCVRASVHLRTGRLVRTAVYDGFGLKGY